MQSEPEKPDGKKGKMMGPKSLHYLFSYYCALAPLGHSLFEIIRCAYIDRAGAQSAAKFTNCFPSGIINTKGIFTPYYLARSEV
jgi:hypothetical protein